MQWQNPLVADNFKVMAWGLERFRLIKGARNLQNGLTLVEVLVSVTLIVVLLTAAASTILNSQFLSSYAKHKIQAAYVGQQILEQERRLGLSGISSQPSAAVTLDTKGTYGTTSDDFLGNRVITVTAIDAYRKMVQVEINWLEQFGAGKITMREYFKATLSDESTLN